MIARPALARYSRIVVEAGLWLAIAGTALAWTDAVYAEYVLPKLLMLSAAVLICAVGVALAAFSGKTPDWMVQMPAASVEAISASSSSRATPRPWAAGST